MLKAEEEKMRENLLRKLHFTRKRRMEKTLRKLTRSMNAVSDMTYRVRNLEASLRGSEVGGE